MMIVSAAEMRAIDRATSERFGVPSLTLMENAGSAVARFILADYSQAQRIAIICGKGNNGGDGFVVARKLAEAGRAVRVLLLCAPEELRGDAAALFQQLTIRPLVVSEPARLGLKREDRKKAHCDHEKREEERWADLLRCVNNDISPAHARKLG